MTLSHSHDCANSCFVVWDNRCGDEKIVTGFPPSSSRLWQKTRALTLSTSFLDWRDTTLDAILLSLYLMLLYGGIVLMWVQTFRQQRDKQQTIIFCWCQYYFLCCGGPKLRNARANERFSFSCLKRITWYQWVPSIFISSKKIYFRRGSPPFSTCRKRHTNHIYF